jgi:phosphoribosylaminoimidazole carboxylase PurE protein
MNSLVVIILGSTADLEHGQAVATALARLGVPAEIRVGSAHKTPAHVLQFLQEYEADPRPKVYVTIAGRSNALSGFVDGLVLAPVIACPPPSTSFGGADIFSSLRMPSGVAPAVTLEPAAAALLAAKMLALADPALGERIAAYKREMAERLLADDRALRPS